MKASDYQPFESAGWRGTVLAEQRDLVDGVDPLDRLLAMPHSVIVERSAVRTLRVEPYGSCWYARHMTGLKSRGDGSGGGIVDQLRWRFGPSRAMRILQISLKMTDRGILAPPVVLAARRKSANGVEDLLVTQAVEATSLLDLLRSSRTAAERGKLLTLAGGAVAQLHHRGFVHGDLLPGNLLVNVARGEVYFIDNERTRFRPLLSFDLLRRRNLSQMVCRLAPLFAYHTIGRFLESYYQARGLPDRVRRREQARVLGYARRRREKIDDQQRAAGRTPILDRRRGRAESANQP